MSLPLLCLQPPWSCSCLGASSRPCVKPRNATLASPTGFPMAAAVCPPCHGSIPKQPCLLERQVRSLPSCSLQALPRRCSADRSRARDVLSTGSDWFADKKPKPRRLPVQAPVLRELPRILQPGLWEHIGGCSDSAASPLRKSTLAPRLALRLGLAAFTDKRPWAKHPNFHCQTLTGEQPASDLVGSQGSNSAAVLSWG